jgi:SAM-dependent methyltransferase
MRAWGLDLQVLREKKVIGAGRRNTACPWCYASDRERLILMYIRDHTHMFDATQKAKVLHVAPENHLSHILLKLDHLEYVCVDRMDRGYTYAGHVQYMDILHIAFPDNHFDYVICNHVLEHIVDDKRAMSELCRVLKPGGTAILQVPISNVLKKTIEDFSVTDPKEKERLFGQFDHVRIYARDYKNRLASAGFTPRITNISSEPRYENILLNPEEDLYVMTKSLDDRS